MADETEKPGLSEEELESQSGEALPDREAMSVVWIEPEPIPADPGSGTAADELTPLRGGEEV